MKNIFIPKFSCKYKIYPRNKLNISLDENENNKTDTINQLSFQHGAHFDYKELYVRLLALQILPTTQVKNQIDQLYNKRIYNFRVKKIPTPIGQSKYKIKIKKERKQINGFVKNVSFYYRSQSAKKMNINKKILNGNFSQSSSNFSSFNENTLFDMPLSKSNYNNKNEKPQIKSRDFSHGTLKKEIMSKQFDINRYEEYTKQALEPEYMLQNDTLLKIYKSDFKILKHKKINQLIG